MSYESEEWDDFGEAPDVEGEIAKAKMASETDQGALIAYLVANHSLFVKSVSILKPEYFDDPYRKAVDFMIGYWQKYRAVPGRVLVQSRLGQTLDEVGDAHDKPVVDYLHDAIEGFCRYRATEKFLLSAADRIDEDRSATTIAALLKEMTVITRISMKPDLGSEIHDDFGEMIERMEANSNISTGIPLLDRALGGGFTRPSLTIYSAPTGGGKSIFMANLAVYYARKYRENVVYYTMENSEEITHKRLAAIMTETDIGKVYAQRDEIKRRLSKDAKSEGRVYVKRFPITGTTIAQIEAHYYDLIAESKQKIGMVCIDYFDVMSPVVKSKSDDIHSKDKQIAQEIYEFAHANKQIVVSASQMTKGSEKEANLTKSNVSGGTHKINTCDNLLIGHLTEIDMEEERFWIRIDKNRSGGGTGLMIPIHWDHMKSQIMKDGDGKLFEEANPRLFGRKRSDAAPIQRHKKDPIVAEMGGSVDVNKTKNYAGQERQADEVRKQLVQRVQSRRISRNDE